MKKLLFLLLLSASINVHSQPKKIWTKIFGGNNGDVGNIINPYNDTMLISAGRSSSTNVGGNKGGDDFMVCQFKPNGDLIRLKTFGGPLSEQLNSYVKLPSGNLILGGYTSGKGGDVSNLYGLTDVWLVGYNPNNGTKIWEKSIGGTNNDQLNDLFYLEPGRIFIAGHTKSIDKDVVNTTPKGGNDIFIASVDETGVLVKAQTFGGTKDETAKKILKADEFGGQMLVFGESESSDLDFSGMNQGKKDIFILKINRNINKVFLTTIGGPGDDLFADAINLGDAGIFIFGTVNTPGGQVDSLKGGKDIWMAKLNSSGILQWKKNIGGRNDETAVKAKINSNGEIILLANSNSRDQDIAANYGGSDVLLMKLDTLGNIIWQKNYGGTAGDLAGAFCFDPSENIYVLAQSFSINNDLPSTNTTPPDFWTFKLFDCVTKEFSYTQRACIGDTVTIHNKKYFVGKQKGNDTLKGVTVNGCDSIVHIAIVFDAPSVEQITDTLCNEATITINNIIFDKTKPNHAFKFTNHLGCDSFLLVDLLFSPAIELIDTIITKDDGTGSGCIFVMIDGGCKPYSFQWSNGSTATQICGLVAGKYTLTLTDCEACSKEFSFDVGLTVRTDVVDTGHPEILYTKDDILIKQGIEPVKTIHLFSVYGQLLMKKDFLSTEIRIARNSIPGGIYLIRFMDKNAKEVQMKIAN